MFVSKNSFYWEHADDRISLRIVYQSDDKSVIGFNAMGTRLRHALCDKWIREKRKIDDVMADLHLLNFDAEFSKKYYNEMIKAYNSETGKSVKRKGSMKLFSFH